MLPIVNQLHNTVKFCATGITAKDKTATALNDSPQDGRNELLLNQVESDKASSKVLVARSSTML